MAYTRGKQRTERRFGGFSVKVVLREHLDVIRENKSHPQSTGPNPIRVFFPETNLESTQA